MILGLVAALIGSKIVNKHGGDSLFPTAEFGIEKKENVLWFLRN